MSIADIRCRRGTTGAVDLIVPGMNSAPKADVLALHLKLDFQKSENVKLNL